MISFPPAVAAAGHGIADLLPGDGAGREAARYAPLEEGRQPIAQAEQLVQISADQQDGAAPGPLFQDALMDEPGGADVHPASGLADNEQGDARAELPGDDRFLHVAAGQGVHRLIHTGGADIELPDQFLGVAPCAAPAQVQAQDAEGYDISSKPSRFRVLPIPPLPVPQNRMPQGGYTITTAQIRASRSVVFSWDRVEGANAYILTVFQGNGPDRKTVIQTPVLKEPGYTVEDIRDLGRGDFSWQVEALYVMDDGYIEQRGRLEENKLTVDIPVPTQIRTKDSGILYGE